MAKWSPGQRKLAVTGLFFVLAAAAFALRVPRLDVRPLHTDEAVHTVKAGELLARGTYIYDKHDYHGPTIYYCAFPLIWAGGAHNLEETREWMFRAVPVIFGSLMLLLLPLLLDAIGPGALVVAGLLLTVSPAFVFYSRYYIQEIPFVFFTLGFLATGWRYYRSGRFAWAAAAGLFMGLMQATKETSVIAWTAMGLALGYTYVVWWWQYGRKKTPFTELKGGANVVSSNDGRDAGYRLWHFAAAGAVAVVVAVAILTDFFHNPKAVVDAAMTYFAYIDRSKGATPHDHPFFYYLSLLAWSREGRGPVWSEGLILALATAGLIAVASRRNLGFGNVHALRFLAIYTVLITLFYAAIPYKTPWCVLTFLQAMTFLAGVGATVAYRLLKYRALRLLFVLLLAAGVAQLAAQACRANYRFYADTRNPYVYGHTSTNFMRLVTRVNDIAKVAPEGRAMLVKVITDDQWPIPWYLRGFTHVGYWPDVPDDVDAPIIVTSSALQDAVGRRKREEYQTELYGIRPDVLVTLHIRKDLWDQFMAARMNAQ